MGRPKISLIKSCINCQIDFDATDNKRRQTCSNKCLEEYKLKTKDQRMKNTFNSIKKKYGKNSFFETNDFYKKAKEIKKEKYGDENYNNIDQIKKTLKKNHNVESPSQIKNFDKLSKKSKKERYGDENFNNREKAKQTILNTYNETHHLKTEKSLNKLKQTNKQKYGVDYTIQSEKAKKELKKHNQKKYKSNFYFESDKHKNTLKEEKLNKLKKILDDNELSFNLNDYDKLRNKKNEKINYIKYNITCNKCKNTFQSSLEIIPICRVCYPINSCSKQQLELKEFLLSLNISFIENTKQIITPFELDFFIPESNIAIELNGNYFHSEIGGEKNKNYHLTKSKAANEKNIKLIHIFEDEWLFKKNIIKSRLKNVLNKTSNKIYARNCLVKQISFEEKKHFLENNHIQGNDISCLNLGLFLKEDLVSVLTFSKPRLALGKKNNIKNQLELSRFCSKHDFIIIGAFEKLLKFFKNTNTDIETIFTYADCRWSGIDFEKTIYHKCGFKFIHHSKPNYFYMFRNNYLNRFHRFQYNKQKMLKLFKEDKSYSEWEIAQKNNMDRIWDCGSLKFELNLKQ